jgi:hypothetical protein
MTTMRDDTDRHFNKEDDFDEEDATMKTITTTTRMMTAAIASTKRT